MNPENVSQVQNVLNKLDKTLRYAVDMLQNDVPYFFDCFLSADGIQP